ncbi:MAG: cadherin-like beta sandwich domain-containing protein [Oscillospiraceae bacterium]|nr:cadherin-like beta sandwich domain-containing protein [Oscillospiraceae bacterium]
MKRYINLILILILCFSLLSVTAFAAGESATLTGPGQVRAGDTITVALNVTGNGIYGASGILSYNSSQLTFVKAEPVVGSTWAVEFNGNHFVAYDNNLSTPIRGTAAMLALTFKVVNVAPGTVITVSCDDLAVSDGNADAKLGSVSYQTTVLAPKSTDNNLQSLTVSNATLSPAFSAGTTSYTAEVPFSVSQLDIQAVANSGKASVRIDNPVLTPGATTNVKVTVTAENGSVKTYTIAVKRAQDPNYVASGNNLLSGINVSGFQLSPAFQADKTDYVIWLPYETESVSVTGTAADSKASVRVEGGTGLVAGQDNVIKVICIAENGTEKVYTIIAKRAAAHDGSTEPTQPSQPTQPNEPTQPNQPTQPEAPTNPNTSSDKEASGGISWWILILASALCLTVGLLLGIVLTKKK